MKSKAFLVVLTAVLSGCVSTQPPSVPQNSPASPQASEAAHHSPRSVLMADATSQAINARLRETSDGKVEAGGHEMHGGGMEQMQHTAPSPAPSSESKPSTTGSYYTCVMHPQIHQDKPGNCPICGMKLIKKEAKQPDQNQ